MKKDKVYILYCNIYYEGYFIEYKEGVLHEGYTNNYYIYETREGHLTLTSQNYREHTKIFDNQLDCLIEISRYVIRRTKLMVSTQKMRRLPLKMNKIHRIHEKYHPEEFI